MGSVVAVKDLAPCHLIKRAGASLPALEFCMASERSDSAAWQHLYKKKAWQLLRNEVLFNDSFTCRLCGALASVVDHISPHKGNLDLFYDRANLQSVCKACHDSHCQSRDRLGYSDQVGLDGWPIDPKHPANSGTLRG